MILQTTFKISRKNGIENNRITPISSFLTHYGTKIIFRVRRKSHHPGKCQYLHKYTPLPSLLCFFTLYSSRASCWCACVILPSHIEEKQHLMHLDIPHFERQFVFIFFGTSTTILIRTFVCCIDRHLTVEHTQSCPLP